MFPRIAGQAAGGPAVGGILIGAAISPDGVVFIDGAYGRTGVAASFPTTVVHGRAVHDVTTPAVT